MARAWHLTSRPQGMPTADNFELKDVALPPLGDGTIRVRNHWLSVDPYMRGRMNDVKSYVPPFQVGEPMDGGAIGEVVESNAEGFEPGDLVQHMSGWRDEAVVPARAANKLPSLGAPPEQFLGVLGVTGVTAYFGLLDAAQAKEGDIVFVSAAAGAVGSVVVQIAKAKGMTVIGSAGGPEKCEFVRSLGADHVIDYKAGPILKGLAAAAPDGIDVYFDNVGGDHLDAAFALARNNARFAICGMIEGYNRGRAEGLRFIHADHRRAHPLKGFIVFDYFPRMAEFYARNGPVARERRGQVARDGGRRAREHARCVPRPVQGREHREDAGQALELAGVRVAALVAVLKRFHALRGRAVGEAVRDDRALRLLLQRVVADRFGGAHAFLEVALLHHRLAFRILRVLRPHAGVAIGLQLDLHLDRIAFGLARARLQVMRLAERARRGPGRGGRPRARSHRPSAKSPGAWKRCDSSLKNSVSR